MHMRFIEPVRASDLLALIGSADAPSFLHELLGRLVRDAAGVIAQGFAPHEGLNVRGWDGQSDHSDGTRYVPAGHACWELSAQRDSIGAKASQDYDHRTLNSYGVDPATSTYVAVTLQRWPSKTEWCRHRIATGPWFDVRALDVDDLVAWLSETPDVHEWATARIQGQRLGFSLRPPVHELPLSLAAFVDRPELWRRLQQGSENSHGPFIASVWGGPGTGKTSLAIHFANQIRGSYPDGCFFEDGRSAGGNELDVERLKRRIVAALIGEQTEPRDGEDLQSLYRSATSERQILVVVDDVIDAEALRGLVPNSTRAALIATSRRRFGSLDGAIEVEVARMTGGESLDLLSSIVGSQLVNANPRAAKSVVELCARVPLAVRLAGSIVALNPDWGLKYVEEQLRKRGARLESLQDRDKAVRATFQVSFSLLRANTAQLFTAIALIPGRYFDAGLADAALGDTCNVQLRELSEFGLVERAQTPGEYYLHDLARDFALEACRVHESSGGNSLRPTYIRIANHLLLKTHEYAAALDPNLREVARRNGITVADSRDEAIAWLDRRIQNVVQSIPPTVEKIAGIEPVVSATGPILTYLGMRNQWSTQREIARLVRSYMDEYAEKTNTADVLRATLAIQEAEALVRMADTDEALSILNSVRATGIHRSNVGLAPGLLNALGNVAVARGDLADAIAAYRESQRLARGRGDQAGERTASYNLGRTLRLLGKERDALEALQHEYDATALVGDDWGAAITLNMIGITLADLGRAEEAIEHQTRARTIFRRFGDRHNEANALFDLGMAYAYSGKPDSALHLWREEISIRDELGDEENANHTRASIAYLCAVNGLGNQNPEDPDLVDLINTLSPDSANGASFASRALAAQALLYYRQDRYIEADSAIGRAVELADVSRQHHAIIAAASIEIELSNSKARQQRARDRAYAALGDGEHPSLRRLIADL